MAWHGTTSVTIVIGLPFPNGIGSDNARHQPVSWNAPCIVFELILVVEKYTLDDYKGEPRPDALYACALF